MDGALSPVAAAAGQPASLALQVALAALQLVTLVYTHHIHSRIRGGARS